MPSNMPIPTAKARFMGHLEIRQRSGRGPIVQCDKSKYKHLPGLRWLMQLRRWHSLDLIGQRTIVGQAFQPDVFLPSSGNLANPVRLESLTYGSRHDGALSN